MSIKAQELTPDEHRKNCGPFCEHTQACQDCVNVHGLCEAHVTNPGGTWTWKESNPARSESEPTCGTCNGDGMVLLPEKLQPKCSCCLREYEPCPDCSPKVQEYTPARSGARSETEVASSRKVTAGEKPAAGSSDDKREVLSRERVIELRDDFWCADPKARSLCNSHEELRRQRSELEQRLEQAQDRLSILSERNKALEEESSAAFWQERCEAHIMRAAEAEAERDNYRQQVVRLQQKLSLDAIARWR